MLLRPILSRTIKHHGAANLCILKNGGPAILSPGNAIPPSSSEEKSIDKGYVVSYLVNSCGLSAKNAVSASKKVHFDCPEKSNAVLQFLEKQGFNKTQISELVRRQPQLLVSKPEESLLPKIEFFLHLTGIPEKDVLTTLARYPFLWTRYQDRVAPVYNCVEDLIGAAKARALFMEGSSTFTLDPETLIPNVDLLRKLGVPPCHIESALFNYPLVFSSKHVDFTKIVEELKQLGFIYPWKSMFMLAINALKGKGNRGLWDECYLAYSKWGWSASDIYNAFLKHPGCMLLSDKKISKALDFLVNEVGRDPRSVAHCPHVLFYSLEKMTIPRCSIVHLLCLKGLVKKDWSLSSVLCPVEKDFVARYVTRFAEEIPQIYDIYQEKLGLSDKA